MKNRILQNCLGATPSMWLRRIFEVIVIVSGCTYAKKANHGFSPETVKNLVAQEIQKKLPSATFKKRLIDDQEGSVSGKKIHRLSSTQWFTGKCFDTGLQVNGGGGSTAP